MKDATGGQGPKKQANERKRGERSSEGGGVVTEEERGKRGYRRWLGEMVGHYREGPAGESKEDRGRREREEQSLCWNEKKCGGQLTVCACFDVRVEGRGSGVGGG